MNNDRSTPNVNSSACLLDLCLFGTFEARFCDSPPLPFPSRKAQWLLAYLALHLGQEVPRDRIAGLLWPDSEPQKALFNLRQTLSLLRRALGAAGERLTAVGQQTLKLEPAGVHVDVSTFDASAVSKERANREQALALYRGPLLADCPEAWAILEREARAQTYLNLLEQLASEARTEGRTSHAIRWLRMLVSADPYRESAYGVLMQSLAEAGDRAAMTRVYHDLRLKLRDDLNTTPSPEIESLYQQLLHQKEQTRLPLPTAAAPSVPIRKLPVPLNGLVGREREIEEVSGWLRARRMVTLTGTGGVGKTRLAIAVADTIAERFPEGVWFVDLAPLTDPALLAKTVATTLGLTEASDCPVEETLQTALTTQTLLLVLDNCEHLLEDCAVLANRLLSVAVSLRILATSREPLGLPGEQIVRVPSLPLPPTGEREKNSTALMEYEAVRLFIERAVQANPQFRLTTQNAASVAEICHCLDGIPLALELAAAWVRSLSVEDIHRRLDNRFHLLTRGNRAALPRHQTLRALIDWSYELLGEQERLLLCRLSVFAGGWTLEAAEAVCAGASEAGAGIEERELLDLLTSLVDKSLVIADTQGAATRYRLLETVRQYAQEGLQARGEAETVRGWHRDHFLWLAEAAEPLLKGPEQAEWLERLESEHDNLRAALRWCAERHDGAQVGLQLSGALTWFWFIRGYWSEGRAALEAALGRSGTQGTSLERARALNGAGSMALKLCDYPAARRFHEECLAVRTALGDRRGIGASYGNLGLVAEEQADYPSARANYERCLAIFREVGDRFNIAQVLLTLGQVARALGDYREARAYFEESLAISREAEDRFGTCTACGSLGTLSLDEGDYARARALLEECLALSRELGLKRGVAYALTGQGRVALGQNDLALARTLLQEGLRLFEELGARNGVADALEGLALLSATQADGERAARLWGAAEALREAIQSPASSACQEEQKEQVAAIRAKCEADRFDQAWAAGRSLSVEQALALAFS